MYPVITTSIFYLPCARWSHAVSQHMSWSKVDLFSYGQNKTKCYSFFKWWYDLHKIRTFQTLLWWTNNGEWLWARGEWLSVGCKWKSGVIYPSYLSIKFKKGTSWLVKSWSNKNLVIFLGKKLSCHCCCPGEY